MNKIYYKLNCQLYSYQIQGVNWMLNHIKHNTGCILADDMGLGKTIQIISLIATLLNNNSMQNGKDIIIIIAPKTLILNWQKEFIKFAPEIKISVYTDKRGFIPKVNVLLVPESIIHYDLIILSKPNYFLLIVDEAHTLKNYKGRKKKEIHKINARHKIALTGTPIINNLCDYWSILDFVNPGCLNTINHFHAHFRYPIEYERNLKAFNLLRKLTQPFILRRLKTNVLTLPKKTVIDHYCDLLPQQDVLYKTIIGSDKLLLYKKEIEEEDKKLLLEMKPRPRVKQALIDVNYAKRLCYYPKAIMKLIKLFYGNQPTKEQRKLLATNSAKMHELIKIIKPHKNRKERGLIFTQTIKNDYLSRILEKKGISTLFLNGKCTREKREEIIKQFQDPFSTIDVLIVSLFVGSVGLNLTAATYVVHFELWWNAALEDQATDRIYRIGQKYPVTVYRFITKNTWEEELNVLIQYKKQNSNNMLADCDSPTGEELNLIDIKDIVNTYYQERTLELKAIKLKKKKDKVNNNIHKKSHNSNILKSLQNNSWYLLPSNKYKANLYIDEILYNKQLFYYKFRINPEIYFKDVLLLPPGKTYLHVQTTSSNEIFYSYYLNRNKYIIIDDISKIKTILETLPKIEAADGIIINLSKLFNQCYKITDIITLIDLCFTKLSESHLTFLHLVTNIKGYKLYNENNVDEIKTYLTNTFKNKLIPKKYNKSSKDKSIIIEIYHSKNELYKELVLFLNKKPFYYHTIISKYTIHNYNKNVNEILYLKNVREILKEYFKQYPEKKNIWEKYSHLSVSGSQDIIKNFGYIANANQSAVIFDQICNKKIIRLFKDLIFDNNFLFKTENTTDNTKIC